MARRSTRPAILATLPERALLIGCGATEERRSPSVSRNCSVRGEGRDLRPGANKVAQRYLLKDGGEVWHVLNLAWSLGDV